jgi:hypothetical protein
MPTLTVTEEQLRLIQKALDMYSRIGIGQMWVIKEHPTFEGVLREKLRPKKELEVGDRTEYGEVLEITKNKVKTKGTWNTKEEIREYKKDEVKLSIDYNSFHDIRDKGEKILNQGRNILLQHELHDNANYGIHNPNVHESCRVAFDLIQVIRHEFWKRNPDRSEITVDSSCHLSTKDSNKIECVLD